MTIAKQLTRAFDTGMSSTLDSTQQLLDAIHLEITNALEAIQDTGIDCVTDLIDAMRAGIDQLEKEWEVSK